jgi:putative ABC transport system permease protein
MLVGELLRVAWRAVTAHKLRSVLTLLGVIIGVMTVIAVVAVITGMNNYVATRLFTVAPDVYAVTRWGIITSRDEFLQALKRKRIEKREVEEMIRLSRTAETVGLLSGTQRPVKRESERVPDVNINGVTANVADLRNLDLEAGRFFTENENERRAFVAVIGSEVRDQLFPRIDPLEKTIQIGGITFRVVGVLVRQGSVLGQSQDNVVYIPRETLCKAWGANRNIAAYVRARGGVPGVPASMDEMRTIFRAIRRLKPDAPEPVSFVTSEAIQAVWRTISAGAFSLLVFISGISLVVGAIVIANIMLVSVVERTKEIGLRLAVGARKADIRRQFLLEAILLAFGGGTLGVFFGWTIALCVDAFSPLPARVTAGLVASGLVLATLTGLAAGVFPAVKASHLPPIEALRHE